MLVYQSRYVIMNYDKESSLLEVLWTRETENATDKEFKSEAITYLETLQTYHPERVLFNTTDTVFPINLDLQIWGNSNIILKTPSTGLKKTAIVISADPITRLSIEQLFDEDIKQTVKRKFFETIEEARAWLLI
jgi:hypothetical protein